MSIHKEQFREQALAKIRQGFDDGVFTEEERRFVEPLLNMAVFGYECAEDDNEAEKRKRQREIVEAKEEFERAKRTIHSQIDGLCTAMHYLLSDSVCGAMTHRHRDLMARHALFAIDKMKAECLHEIDSIYFADELPF